MGAVVETTCGKLKGFEENGIKVFKGIPFAAPPVGERRWLAPEPVVPWEGVRDAASYGSTAPQLVAEPVTAIHKAFVAATGREKPQPMDEDCLYLNVWTPGLDDAKRPVMVWIHGGGFTAGTGSSPLHESAILPKKGDVVLVTINYRLNVFGFLRLNEVTGGKIPSTGNEGMLDQVAALGWVRDNIAAFGGDPGNVTIFGLSAGGGSVGALLGMPRAKGLFHKAISHSGSAHFHVTTDGANRYAEFLLKTLGVDVADTGALRALSMKEVLRGYVKAIALPDAAMEPPLPIVDGEVFPELPADSIAAGSADGIPVIAGSCADEWRLWLGFDPALADLSESHMLGRIRKSLPYWDPEPTIEAYRALLPERGVEATPSEIHMAIMTARMFWIPTLRMLESLNARGNPAYNYLITWKSPLMDGVLGACHAIDHGFLWGAHGNDFYGSGPAADAFSNNMQDAWLAFARTGDPCCDGLGKWPTYGEKGRDTMVFDDPSRVEQAPLEEERRIWESIPNEVFRWS